MFCKFIKLTNGDNIIAYTEDSCETFKDQEFVEVHHPIQVGLVRYPRNGVIMESHMFMPWIAASSSESIKIPVASILVTTDVRDNIAKQYDIFINKVIIEDAEDGDEEGIELSDEEDIEDFFSMFTEESETEEDDSTSNRRTIH